MRTENWFREDEEVGTQHIVFNIMTRGEHEYVEVEYGLWGDILDTLGFKPEIVVGEVLDRTDET